MEFCHILKDLRIERHLSQKELAKKIGIEQSMLSKWERGVREPVLHSLIKIAKFFDVSIDYLVGLSSDR